MELIYLLQVSIIVFNGSGQTCPKYPKLEVGNAFAIYIKSFATAFVFYCDAKKFRYFMED